MDGAEDFGDMLGLGEGEVEDAGSGDIGSFADDGGTREGATVWGIEAAGNGRVGEVGSSEGGKEAVLDEDGSVPVHGDIFFEELVRSAAPPVFNGEREGWGRTDLVYFEDGRALARRSGWRRRVGRAGVTGTIGGGSEGTIVLGPAERDIAFCDGSGDARDGGIK
jgi:hypothetical protein